ncbi:MAG: hypothetical protein PVG70_03275, partial [Desulfobacterales bacterium]
MKLVPTNRLLFWVGVIALPFSISAAIAPDTALAGIGLSTALLFGSIFDGIVSKNRLHGIRVTLPEVVRMSVGRQAEMILTIENDGFTVKRLRLGLAFPREIYARHQDFSTELPESETNSIVTWRFDALKQGRYLLESCYLETPSVFGFWSIRRCAATKTEIRVYPDLFRERRKLSALFLNRGIGTHAQRQVG